MTLFLLLPINVDLSNRHVLLQCVLMANCGVALPMPRRRRRPCFLETLSAVAVRITVASNYTIIGRRCRIPFPRHAVVHVRSIAREVSKVGLRVDHPAREPSQDGGATSQRVWQSCYCLQRRHCATEGSLPKIRSVLPGPALVVGKDFLEVVRQRTRAYQMTVNVPDKGGRGTSSRR